MVNIELLDEFGDVTSFAKKVKKIFNMLDDQEKRNVKTIQVTKMIDTSDSVGLAFKKSGTIVIPEYNWLGEKLSDNEIKKSIRHEIGHIIYIPRFGDEETFCKGREK